MDGLGSLCIDAAFFAKSIVEHTEVAKRYVGSDYVKAVVFRLLAVNRFKSFDEYLCVGMQGGQYKSGKQVFLKSRPMCSHISDWQETADTGGRF